MATPDQTGGAAIEVAAPEIYLEQTSFSSCAPLSWFNRRLAEHLRRGVLNDVYHFCFAWLFDIHEVSKRTAWRGPRWWSIIERTFEREAVTKKKRHSINNERRQWGCLIIGLFFKYLLFFCYRYYYYLAMWIIDLQSKLRLKAEDLSLQYWNRFSKPVPYGDSCFVGSQTHKHCILWNWMTIQWLWIGPSLVGKRQ